MRMDVSVGVWNRTSLSITIGLKCVLKISEKRRRLYISNACVCVCVCESEYVRACLRPLCA